MPLVKIPVSYEIDYKFSWPEYIIASLFFSTPGLVMTTSLLLARMSLLAGSVPMLVMGTAILLLATWIGWSFSLLFDYILVLLFVGALGYLVAFPFLLPGTVFFVGWYKRMQLGKRGV